jgi:hypothetical protein
MPIKFLNNVAVDSDVLYVDTASNEVGIGTTNPLTKLQVGDGTADDAVRSYFNDGNYTEMRGYGLQFSRAASYIRPTADNTKTLYLGSNVAQWNTLSIDASTTTFNTNGSENMRIDSTGKIQFNEYGAGTITGTAARNLSVDSSGNIIETSTSASGSGTTNVLPIWTNGPNGVLGDSLITQTRVDGGTIFDLNAITTGPYTPAINTKLFDLNSGGTQKFSITQDGGGGVVLPAGGGVTNPGPSFNMGGGAFSNGKSGVAMGSTTTAFGNGSLAANFLTLASGGGASAFGLLTEASALASAAFGNKSVASGNYSIASGQDSIASGQSSVAIGEKGDAQGKNTLVQGFGGTATANNAVKFGYEGSASGNNSAKFGFQSVASGANSLATGTGTTASGLQSIATGDNNVVSNNNSFVVKTVL